MAKMSGHAGARGGASELDQRVAADAAISQREALVGKIAILDAVVILPAIDRLADDAVELDVPVDVGVVVGAIDAVDAVHGVQALAEEELHVGPHDVVRFPGAEIADDKGMLTIAMD